MTQEIRDRLHVTAWVFILFGIASIFAWRMPTPHNLCPDPIGWAYADSCVESDLIPPIQVGQTTSQSFWFKPTTEYTTLSYIIGDFNCGPIAPYNALSFVVYNSDCDSILYSGSIFPVQSGNFIWLDTARTYVITYTWTAQCEQYSACPIINPSYLPLTWLSVQAKYIVQFNTVKVTWTTASEVGCDYFVIERQCGVSWCDIGKVPAKGNTTYSTVYGFEDQYPDEDNHYRIRQVDNDGKFQHSKVVYAHGRAVADCYYMTMLGVNVGSDPQSLKPGPYIRRCNDSPIPELITITQ